MINVAKLSSAIFSGGIKGHFGQWAEDVLIRKLFPKNKKDGIYLDLGSYHPFTHSNTAYFWMKGWSGINVDANPNTIKLFQKTRPQDNNIWTAIIPNADYESGIHEIALLLPEKSDGHNGVAATGTVSSNVGNDRGYSNQQLVPAKSIQKLVADFNIPQVDYMNLDIEGYDEMILKEIDFSKINPKVISIEDYSKSLAELTSSSITKFMEEKGYALVGRAGPTSIFFERLKPLSYLDC